MSVFVFLSHYHECKRTIYSMLEIMYTIISGETLAQGFEFQYGFLHTLTDFPFSLSLQQGKSPMPF